MDTATKARLPLWLHRTASGDSQAFEALYQATSPQLFAIAVRLVHDQRLAEDVLQDAFVQVWHRAGDYHAARGTVFTWMSTLVRYRAIDLLRKRQRSAGTGSGAIDIDAMDIDTLFEFHSSGESEDPLAETLNADQSSWLNTCLQRLSELQRKCLALAYFQGLSHNELSEALTQPLGTVKSRIRRGLARLKECLEELTGGNNETE